ncbi:MAG: general secretion pathway protein GspK [Candidatus Omnitrophota bacterium]|nr:MAG: general secretion pathway protein GspK [Candidatus Omnitrophota bacterium]
MNPALPNIMFCIGDKCGNNRKKGGVNKDRGAILIVTLWVLAILTLFAIALGKQASLEVKLAGYQRDKIRAIGLARAAIERAIAEREKWEEENSLNPDIDTLNEPWANNEEVFKDIELGDETFSGTFTVSYSLDGDMLYGMEDESSKININKVGVGQLPLAVLANLLDSCGVEEAGEVVSTIVAWRNKNGDFESIPELLLVRYEDEEDEVITPQILYGEDKDEDGKISEEEAEGALARYLTVHSDGKININTASEKVLAALIRGTPSQGEDPEALLDLIVNYRKTDEEIGNEDDGWFSANDIKNLIGQPAKNIGKSYNPDTGECAPFNKAEWDKLYSLVSTDKLCVSSDIYTIYTQAQVNKVKATITATVDLRNPAKPYLYWHRN